MSGNDRTALVIGATGGVGGATAAALLKHGWRVRAMNRVESSSTSLFSTHRIWMT